MERRNSNHVPIKPLEHSTTHAVSRSTSSASNSQGRSVSGVSLIRVSYPVQSSVICWPESAQKEKENPASSVAVVQKWRPPSEWTRSPHGDHAVVATAGISPPLMEPTLWPAISSRPRMELLPPVFFKFAYKICIKSSFVKFDQLYKRNINIHNMKSISVDVL